MRYRHATCLALALLLGACNFRTPPTGPTTVTTTVTTTVGQSNNPTPTPTPTGGGGTGGGGTGGGGIGRVPDPPIGTALPLPAYAQAEVLAYAATSAGAAALVTACPGTTNANQWAFMDGLIDRLRARDTRWGYFCRRGNCFDPSNDVVGYHATAGPDVSGAAGTIGVDVIGDLCGTNTPQAVPYPFDATALWTTRGRF